jgi:tetratricopeptide (TPR) repeat protein
MLHTSVGDVLRKMAGADGNMDLAIAEYRRAIGYDPDYNWAHNNLGLILHAQGKLDDAIAEFRRATKNFSELEGINDNLAQAVQEREARAPKEAAAAFKE